jgi:PTS system ascorbate-specific IIA component
MTESSSTGEFSLANLLPFEAVSAKVEAADWREAVTVTGDLLVSTGSTTPQYTEQMIAALERLGPYIVVAPGFALAHAQASDDVLRTGMSFVQLAEPVAFGHKKNDPVRIVVGLASKDHSAHMAALKELSQFMVSKEKMDVLATAESREALAELLGINKQERES